MSLKYKVTVLGNIGTGDKTFEVDCNEVVYENESISFKKLVPMQGNIVMLSVPQNCSVIELLEM